ncbi:MAG: hypothetical protein H6666_01595 [Ardenticatenaceae bacterium]|nr:hypothetical protein [Anaerolineales bacterium]MCB8916590.1 hypothetical protein [Ardenticatenaceae bacterium]
MSTMSPTNASDNGPAELRLMARIVAFLALLTGLLYLRAMLSEGWLVITLDPFGPVGVIMVGLLVVAILGLLAAWRWEAPGGLIAMLSAALLGLLVFATTESYPWLQAFVYSSPFLLTGLLFLLCWWRNRRAQSGT